MTLILDYSRPRIDTGFLDAFEQIWQFDGGINLIAVWRRSTLDSRGFSVAVRDRNEFILGLPMQVPTIAHLEEIIGRISRGELFAHLRDKLKREEQANAYIALHMAKTGKSEREVINDLKVLHPVLAEDRRNHRAVMGELDRLGDLEYKPRRRKK